MVLIFWMLQHLSVCKGFFTIKPAKSADGVHTTQEVDAYIHKCIAENAMAGLNLAAGIGNMWRDVNGKKHDAKATLQKMLFQADRQIDMGYLTPSMLGLLDTRLYCAVRGGVNTAFGSGCGGGLFSNQPEALKAHDKFLHERAVFHFT
jgi:hypothetical protein